LPLLWKAGLLGLPKDNLRRGQGTARGPAGMGRGREGVPLIMERIEGLHLDQHHHAQGRFGIWRKEQLYSERSLLDHAQGGGRCLCLFFLSS